MDCKPSTTNGVVLWEMPDGLRCTLTSRTPPFEITVQRGDETLTRSVFEHHEEAAAFAIAAMHAAEAFDPIRLREASALSGD